MVPFFFKGAERCPVVDGSQGILSEGLLLTTPEALADVCLCPLVDPGNISH